MHNALTEWPGRLSSPATTHAQRGFARAWVTVPPGAAPPPPCSASPSKRHRPALGSPVCSSVWPRPGAAWQGPGEWPTKPRCRTPSPPRASLPSPSSIRSLDATPGALPNRRSWSSTAKLCPKVRIYAETSPPLGRACVNTPRRHIPTRAAASTSFPRVYPSLSLLSSTPVRDVVVSLWRLRVHVLRRSPHTDRELSRVPLVLFGRVVVAIRVLFRALSRASSFTRVAIRRLQ